MQKEKHERKLIVDLPDNCDRSSAMGSTVSREEGLKDANPLELKTLIHYPYRARQKIESLLQL